MLYKFVTTSGDTPETVITGTDSMTVSAGASQTRIDAKALGATKTLTLLGEGSVVLMNFQSILNASRLTGSLDVVMATDAPTTIITGTYMTTVQGDGPISIDASALKTDMPLHTWGKGAVTVNKIGDIAIFKLAANIKGGTTINAHDMTTTSHVLRLDGFERVKVTYAQAIVDGQTSDFRGELDVTAVGGSTLVKTGTNDTTVRAKGAVSVDASAMANDKKLTTTGTAAVTVSDISNVNKFNVVAESKGGTTIDADNLIDSDGAPDTNVLVLSGTQRVAVTNAHAAVDAHALSGMLNVTATAGAYIMTGSNHTTVQADVWAQVNASSLAARKILTLSGHANIQMGAFPVKDIIVDASRLDGRLGIRTAGDSTIVKTGTDITTIIADGTTSVDASAMATDKLLNAQGTGAVKVTKIGDVANLWLISATTGGTSIDAAGMATKSHVLMLSGANKATVMNAKAIVDGQTYIFSGTLDVTAIGGSTQVKTGTNDTTVRAQGKVSVDASSMHSDKKLTTTGTALVTIDNITDVNKFTVVAESKGGTSIDAGNLVDKSTAPDTDVLALSGTQKVTVTNAKAIVDGQTAKFKGVLDVTTTGGSTIVKTGTNNTTVKAEGATSVDASAMEKNKTLTTTGTAAVTVTKISNVNKFSVVTESEGGTTIDANNLSDSDDAPNTNVLALSGTQRATVTSARATVDAQKLSGTLNVATTTAGAYIKTGSNDTVVQANGNTTIQAFYLEAGKTLTLSGGAAGVHTDVHSAKNAIVDAQTFSGTLSVGTYGKSSVVKTGTNDTTVHAQGATTVDASVMTTNKTLTTTGTAPVTVNKIGNVDHFSVIAESRGGTLIDASGLTRSYGDFTFTYINWVPKVEFQGLKFSGTQKVTVTNVFANVDARALSGTLDMMTRKNAQIYIWTGSNSTAVQTDNGQVTIYADSLVAGKTLTLSGSVDSLSVRKVKDITVDATTLLRGSNADFRGGELYVETYGDSTVVKAGSCDLRVDAKGATEVDASAMGRNSLYTDSIAPVTVTKIGNNDIGISANSTGGTSINADGMVDADNTLWLSGSQKATVTNAKAIVNGSNFAGVLDVTATGGSTVVKTGINDTTVRAKGTVFVDASLMSLWETGKTLTTTDTGNITVTLNVSNLDGSASKGNITVTGNRSNTIKTGSGEDLITVGGGNNSIRSGDGNDAIKLSATANGQDVIVFEGTAAANGKDAISQFQYSMDKLDFSTAGWLNTTPGVINSMINSRIDASAGQNIVILRDIPKVSASNFGSTADASHIKTAANTHYVVVTYDGNLDSENVYYVSTDASNVATVALVGTMDISYADLGFMGSGNFI